MSVSAVSPCCLSTPRVELVPNLLPPTSTPPPALKLLLLLFTNCPLTLGLDGPILGCKGQPRLGPIASDVQARIDAKLGRSIGRLGEVDVAKRDGNVETQCLNG